MRHGVIRRGDQVPLTLVHTKQSWTELLRSIWSTAVSSACSESLIIADEGFEGAFHTGVVGLGMDMAFRAGVGLRDMEFITHHPLTVSGTNVFCSPAHA